MNIQAAHLIAGEMSAAGTETFRAIDVAIGEEFGLAFPDATLEEIDWAVRAAAASDLQSAPAEQIALLLEGIATGLEDAGDALLILTSRETGLNLDRLRGERGRTCGQLRIFAEGVRADRFTPIVEESPLPDRKPAPRPRLERRLLPVGPAAVFAASNFPFAFSVAGGDTASALAARCPVILKAHPAHPNTSGWVAAIVTDAVQQARLPRGTFSLLHASSPAASIALVRHRLLRAVAFTGSQRAGMAIFQACAQREEPIPAYVEMGSINPVFVFPGAFEEHGEGIAKGLAASFQVGNGQFCTKPGVVFVVEGRATEQMLESVRQTLNEESTAPALHPGIARQYAESLQSVGRIEGVDLIMAPSGTRPPGWMSSAIAVTNLVTFLSEPQLREEHFGPLTCVVRCKDVSDFARAAEALGGNLTATIWGSAGEEGASTPLLRLLTGKAGRVICNGWPTGVEVSSAMQHGGPFPATAHSHFTSVGTSAIERFLRPVCFQNIPPLLLSALYPANETLKGTPHNSS